MGSLDRRLKRLEADRKRREARLIREALRDLSDKELDALEESLLAETRAKREEPPPTNELLEDILEDMKQLEAEVIDQQRRHTEESRRQAKKGAPQ